MKKLLSIAFALLIVAALGFSQAGAGGTGTGKIIGTIVDQDGNPIPGVSVYLEGERIGKMTAVTSDDGHFRFLNLPVGKGYELRCELPGFNTHIRKGMDLYIGSTVNLEIVMEQAVMEEEITVIASSPLVNTKSTTVARNITAEQIQQLPTSRNPWTVMNLAPGMLIDREDVGGNESGQQSSYYGHGVQDSDSTWRVDGANITDASAIGAAPAYLNMNAYEELQVAYGSNDITAQTGGAQINFVTKRAGNQFSGMFHLYVEDENWERENTSGVDLPEGYISPGIFRLQMYGADFGGPIIKDHLFFYGSWAIQDIHSRTIVGTEDATWLVSGYGKVNWQVGGNMGDVFLAYDAKKKWGRTALGAASQGPGTVWDQVGPGYLIRFADQHVFGDLLLSFKSIYTDGGFSLDPRGADRQGDVLVGEWWYVYFRPSYYWDGAIYLYGTNRNQLNAALDANYFAEDVLGADHEFKFGVDYVRATTTTYVLYPNQAMLYRYSDFGYPFDVFEPNTNDMRDYLFKRYSAYISDTLTFGRFTLMLGLRYDIESNANNPTAAPAYTLNGTPIFTDYLGELSAPGADIDVKWKTFSPRFSLTYDITGDGKNVVKLSLARYGSQLGNGLASFMRVVGTRYIAVPWYDDGDGIPEIGEFEELAPEDSLWYGGFDRTDPYKTTTSDKIDPDHNTPLIDELTITYEREITPDLAVSVSGFYKKRHNYTRTIGIMEDGSIETAANWYLAGNDPNLGQPYYERYERPIANYRTNYKKSHSRYLAASFVLKKRFSHNWMLDASFTYTDWTYRYLDKSEFGYDGGFDLTNFDYFNGGVVAPESGGSGQTDIFVNATWMFKLAGLYQLPYQINLSVVFNAREGYVVPYYADFSRGSGIGATNMYEGGKKFGDDRLPTFWIANLGIEKIFNLTETSRVALHVDAYNVTNNNTVLKQNPVIGPGKDDIQRILNPTVFQFGIRFEF